MFKDIIFAIRFFHTLRTSDANYIVFKKSRDGRYDMYEDGVLYLNRKL